MNKTISNLSGGMNSHTSPLIIKDSEAELILNYNLDKVGSLTRRNGYTKYATNGLYHTSGLFGTMNPNNKSYIAYLSTNNAPFATATERKTYYYKLADDAWTVTNDTGQQPFLPTGAANQVFKTRFVSFLNYIFRLNGGNIPVSFLITTPQTLTYTNLTDNETSAALAIIPSLGSVFQDRVYFNDTADGKRSRVYYSTLGTSGGTISWDTNATTGQWFDVNPDDGDLITAFENNGNRLLIFKTNSLYRWNWGQIEPDRLIGVGTTSQESVKTNFENGVTFFFNPKGVYAYSGTGRPKLISRKIQEYIDAITSANAKYVAGGIDKDHYYLSVGDITVSGRTISNAVLVYHIPLDAWTIYSLAEQPTCFDEIGTSYPTVNLMFGSGNGYVYKMNNGSYDIYGSDTEKTIAAEVIFKEHLLSFPNRTNIDDIDIFAEQRVESSVFYDLDRHNDFKTLGSLQDRITNFNKIPQRECNSVRIKIADNSKNISVISGYNIEHTPKEKRDEVNYRIKKRDSI